MYMDVYTFMIIHGMFYGYSQYVYSFQIIASIYIEYTPCTFYVYTSNSYTYDVHRCIYIYDYTWDVLWIYIVCIFILDNSLNIHRIYVMYISCIYANVYTLHILIHFYMYICVPSLAATRRNNQIQLSRNQNLTMNAYKGWRD